jgi:hypothetical protein
MYRHIQSNSLTIRVQKMPAKDRLQTDLLRQRLLAGNLILASCSVFYNNLKIILLGFLKALRLFPIISLCIDVPWMLYTQWALRLAYKKGIISKSEYIVGATAEATSSLMINIAMAGQVVNVLALGLAGPILFVVGIGITFLYAFAKWILYYKQFREQRASFSEDERQFHVRQLKVDFCIMLAYLGAMIALGVLLLHPIGMMVSGGFFVVVNVTNLILNWCRPIAVLKDKKRNLPQADLQQNNLEEHPPALLSSLPIYSKKTIDTEYISSILTLRSLIRASSC